MPKFQRRIVQIAAAPVEPTASDFALPWYLFALCDDGTSWILRRSGRDGQEFWRPLPDIPQDGLD